MISPQSQRIATLRAARKAARECPYCGVPLPLECPYLSCDACRAAAADIRFRRYHRLAEERCCVSCGVRLGRGDYVRCAPCHMANRERTTALRRKHQEEERNGS